MRIDTGTLILVYLCVLVVSCSCFQKHIQALNAKVNELFGKKVSDDENNIPPVLKPEHIGSSVSQNNNTDDKFHMFGINWRNICSKITNNWWIIAVSSLLPFILFWRIQYNMRNRLQEWKKVFVKKEKPYNYSRRLTLPDLTIARHARRESLAEAKFANRSRKMSQSNISQFRNRRNSIERNDDPSGDMKRVHIIRRRH